MVHSFRDSYLPHLLLHLSFDVAIRHHDKLKEYGFEFMEIRLVVYNLIQKYFSLFISDTIFFMYT